jgi:hypothetical protein
VAGVKLHREAAAPGVLPVLEALSSVLPRQGFYLAGGTALALLEAHRISLDIDIFGSQLDDPQHLLQQLEATIEDIENAALGAGTVYLEIGGVQVSLIAYRYPLLKTPLVASADLIPLAHRDDIAAMKLAAITARGTRKDFIDLWTLISRHHPLEYYLRAFESKFLNRDSGHVIRSLTYFEDADPDPSLRLIAPVDWERVKTDFRTWVKALLVS